MDELAEWEAGEFVAVMYENHWYPGTVTSVEDSGRVQVKCMKYLEEESWTNKFVWPGKKDEDWYEKEGLILKLDPPQEHGCKRQKFYSFSKEDYTGASDLLSVIMETGYNSK